MTTKRLMTIRTPTSKRRDAKAAQRIQERLTRLRPLLDDLGTWLSLIADPETRDRLRDEVDLRLSLSMSDRHQYLVGAALRAPKVPVESLIAAVTNIR